MDQTKEYKRIWWRERKEKERKGKEKKRKEKKIKERKTKDEEKQDVLGKEKGKRKEKGFDSQCSDGRKSLVRELKLVYSMRAMSRCQKIKEVGFFPTLTPFNLRVVNGRVVQPQPWD